MALTLPMKVLYVLNSTLPHGGATKAFLTMLHGQQALGVEPVVVTPDDGGICAELRQQGVRVHILNYRPCLYPYWRTWRDYLLALPRMAARLVINARAVRQLTSIIKKEHVDFVHTNVGVVSIGYRAACRAGVPHIYHIREYADLDFQMYHFPSRAAFRRKLSRSWSVCITADIQRHHRQDGNPRSRVIYDAVGPCIEALPPRAATEPYYLFAGRVEPAKGLLDLLRAYDVDIPLKVAGSLSSGKYLDECRKVVRERRLPVEFLGQRDDLPQLQRQALAQIVPSRFEGFGLCMPEGMRQGCLAIGRNTGGTREQFQNGVRLTGQPIGFPYDTPAELTRLLAHVASLSPAEADAMRQRALHVTNQLYTTDVSARRLHDFYTEILTSLTV